MPVRAASVFWSRMASIQRWHLAVYVAEATIVAGLRIEDAVGIRHVRDRGRPDGWWLLTYMEQLKKMSSQQRRKMRIVFGIRTICLSSEQFMPISFL